MWLETCFNISRSRLQLVKYPVEVMRHASEDGGLVLQAAIIQPGAHHAVLHELDLHGPGDGAVEHEGAPGIPDARADPLLTSGANLTDGETEKKIMQQILRY